MAYITVRLQVSDYSQKSDYNFADQLIQNTAVNAPITFEGIVIFMIKGVIARVISKSDEREARGRFEIRSTITL